MASCRRGDPVSQSPFRLAALQAIELYLNAVLLSRGCTPGEIRGLRHDLARRADLLSDAGLALRARTVAHIVGLNADREYLLARYCAERTAPPPTSQLAATLAEVARKSSAVLQAAETARARQDAAMSAVTRRPALPLPRNDPGAGSCDHA